MSFYFPTQLHVARDLFAILAIKMVGLDSNLNLCGRSQRKECYHTPLTFPPHFQVTLILGETPNISILVLLIFWRFSNSPGTRGETDNAYSLAGLCSCIHKGFPDLLLSFFWLFLMKHCGFHDLLIEAAIKYKRHCGQPTSYKLFLALSSYKLPFLKNIGLRDTFLVPHFFPLQFFGWSGTIHIHLISLAPQT